jgi:hypothetical protein
MERNVTNPFIDRLNHIPASRPHSHDPTPAEIQRWEDDGGAVQADASRLRESAHRHCHEASGELVAA